jgi:pimeloyl-ACP methyl ester carboxylesterase
MRHPYNSGTFLAERGFTVVCFNALGYGDRQLFSVDDGCGRKGGRIGFANLLNTLIVHGDSYLRLYVSDVVRIVNFCKARHLGGKIGMAGFSFGGFGAVCAAAFDTRIQALAALGCAGTDQAKISSGVKVDAVLVGPGFARVGGFAALVRMIAPRPAFFGQAHKDKYARDPQRLWDLVHNAWGPASTDCVVKMYPETGHILTPAMLDDAAEFLSTRLQ